MDARILIEISDGEVSSNVEFLNKEKADPLLVMRSLVMLAKKVGDDFYNGEPSELGQYLYTQISELFGKVTQH